MLWLAFSFLRFTSVLHIFLSDTMNWHQSFFLSLLLCSLHFYLQITTAVAAAAAAFSCSLCISIDVSFELIIKWNLGNALKQSGNLFIFTAILSANYGFPSCKVTKIENNSIITPHSSIQWDKIRDRFNLKLMLHTIEMDSITRDNKSN